MFVQFTPHEGLLFHVDPQDDVPVLTLQLSDTWHIVPDPQVFIVLFPENAIQIEIDANDVLNVWQLAENGSEDLLYSVLIVSPLLAEQVKQQFRQGMPDFEMIYSRFAENDEENNASTILGNNAMSNYSNNTNANMNGGKRKKRQSRKKTRRQRKRTLRRLCKV